MPSWTYNRISISGKDKDKVVSIIKKGIEEEKGLFDTFIPMPDIYKKYDTTNFKSKDIVIGQDYPIIIGECRNTIKITEEIFKDFKKAEDEQLSKYGVIGWYDWSLKYWGCKWDADSLDLEEKKTCSVISFYTPWDAPFGFYKYLMDNYKVNLKFQIQNEGEDVEYFNNKEYVFLNEGTNWACSTKDNVEQCKEYLKQIVAMGF